MYQIWQNILRHNSTQFVFQFLFINGQCSGVHTFMAKVIFYGYDVHRMSLHSKLVKCCLFKEHEKVDCHCKPILVPIPQIS